jgi:hypothetical protein
MVTWLTTATGQTISHVVRERVAVYYAQVRNRQPRKPLRLSAMAGKFISGRGDLSVRVEDLVTS